MTHVTLNPHFLWREEISINIIINRIFLKIEKKFVFKILGFDWLDSFYQRDPSKTICFPWFHVSHVKLQQLKTLYIHKPPLTIVQTLTTNLTIRPCQTMNDKIRSDHMPSRSQTVLGELHCSFVPTGKPWWCLPSTPTFHGIYVVGLSTSSMLLMLHCNGHHLHLDPPSYPLVRVYIYIC